MKKWKILFVGVGSIAKRHIKNVKSLMLQRRETVQIDVFRSNISKKALPDEILNTITESYYDLSRVPDDYDVIFVTNPTQYHLETMEKFTKKGRHFFIEKPLCTLSQLTADKLAIENDRVYYVAAPLRYTAIVNFIKENICKADVLAVRCISSSYLPEWRKDSDYRESYSAHKALGGGVSIDLVHEWDYVSYLFGFPKYVKSIIVKKSDLEIDSDDIAVYIAEYDTMVAEVHVDYIGKSPIREMQIFTKDETIICDFIQSLIRLKKSGREIKFGEERDEYQMKELQYFFERIDNKLYSLDNIKHAEKVLRIAGGVYKC